MLACHDVPSIQWKNKIEIKKETGKWKMPMKVRREQQQTEARKEPYYNYVEFECIEESLVSLSMECIPFKLWVDADADVASFHIRCHVMLH